MTVPAPSDPDGPNPPVVCLGESMAVLTPAREGAVRNGDHFVLSAGGAEFNVASYLAALGQPCAWLGRVGDDPFGQVILEGLRRAGVITDAVRVDPTRPTGAYFKERHGGSTRLRYYRTGSAATAMNVEDLSSSIVQRAPLVHSTGITAALSPSCNELIQHLFNKPRTRGKISFDANWRPGLWPNGDGQALTASLARKADIVFVGLDEANELWGLHTPADVAEFLDFPPALVVKDAANGASMITAHGTTWEPAPAVDVVEPVGAGDAFAAGVIAAMLSGLHAAACLRLGHAVAATALLTTDDVGCLDDVSALRPHLTKRPAAHSKVQVEHRVTERT